MPLLRRLAAPLVAAALAGLAATAPARADTDIGNMTDAERTAFRAEVRAYLLDNPEVIFEAIQILEQRRNKATEVADKDLVANNADQIYRDGYSFVGGNPDGDVTMVEFLDYRCGYCKRAHPHVREVLEQDPNLRYIVKEFPILGPDSVVAGQMAMAALEIDPSKFYELHNRLMSFEGGLTEAAAYRIAGEVGYDVEALKARAGSDEIDQNISKTYELARTLGIQGTPAFVIGDKVIRGYVPAEDLVAAIEAERESASN